MKLREISNLDDANGFLYEEFLPDCNQRFGESIIYSPAQVDMKIEALLESIEVRR